MKIYVEDLEFETIIGILDFERTTPQRVILNLEIEYHYTSDRFIDYAKVANLLKTTLIEEKFFLLEDAINSIFEVLKQKFPQISSLRCKITKPSILPDCKVSVEDFKQFDS